MSKRLGQDNQRLQAAREVNQHVQAAREQTIIRYYYRKRG